MNKLVKKAVIMAMSGVLTASMLPALPAQAAKKKLSVNKVYDKTTKVKGKTKKKYQVRIKIGKKTYKATATKKGNYSVKIPKQAAGKTLTVRIYRKKGKRWKYYIKKKTYVMTKTISVKKFSKSSKYIKGYARPKYRVKVIMNGKTYSKKASSKKGYFSIKMKKAAGNGTAKIYLYNTKGKRIKTYSKKAYNAVNSKPSATTKLPGKEDPINETQVQKDINQVNRTGKDIIGKNDGNSGYRYFIGTDGWVAVGYVANYLYTEADGAHAHFSAKNGITLYFTVSPKRLSQFNWPSKENYDFKLESGENRRFQGTEFKELPDNNLYYKVVGYKNGKLVMLRTCSEYLIAGYNDAMFN